MAQEQVGQPTALDMLASQLAQVSKQLAITAAQSIQQRNLLLQREAELQIAAEENKELKKKLNAAGQKETP